MPDDATSRPELDALVARVSAFVRSPAPAAFDDLALAVLAFQRRHLPAYARLCDARGVPADVGDWRALPPVPTAAFKSVELALAPAVEVFRSSGTTAAAAAAATAPVAPADARSQHFHPFPDLYREIVDASFPAACLQPGERPPMLSLVPSRALAPDSSLAFMVEHVLARFADPERTVSAVGARGVEPVKARSWLSARQRDRRPGVVLATSLALVELVEGLARLDLRFRLPVGTRLFETGGFKTRTRELRPADVAAGVAERLGLGAEAIVREYGMTELTSQCYSRPRSGDPDLLAAPAWTRVRILDPATLAEAAPGTVGLVSVLDLGNVGSAAHVLTEDLGVAEDGGFRLAGRAAGAELRGCSQLTEALAGR